MLNAKNPSQENPQKQFDVSTVLPICVNQLRTVLPIHIPACKRRLVFHSLNPVDPSHNLAFNIEELKSRFYRKR